MSSKLNISPKQNQPAKYRGIFLGFVFLFLVLFLQHLNTSLTDTSLTGGTSPLNYLLADILATLTLTQYASIVFHQTTRIHLVVGKTHDIPLTDESNTMVAVSSEVATIQTKYGHSMPHQLLIRGIFNTDFADLTN